MTAPTHEAVLDCAARLQKLAALASRDALRLTVSAHRLLAGHPPSRVAGVLRTYANYGQYEGEQAREIADTITAAIAPAKAAKKARKAAVRKTVQNRRAHSGNVVSGPWAGRGGAA